MIALPNDWHAALSAYLPAEGFARLAAFLDHRYATEEVLPPREELYTALQLCSFDAVRVVILGQDPYPTPGHAHGLAFSVRPPIAPPGSLRNILKEIVADVGGSQISYGDLRPWAAQGVLLLNAILTVRAHASLSHAKQGWEALTDGVIRALSEKKSHLVFMLWGAKAQEKAALIDAEKHLVLKAPHPSPLSARTGFFGCRHFSRANAYLAAHNASPIQW